ncbi:MAG: prepilin peptidase, partial [Gemmatimonadota bacterium]
LGDVHMMAMVGAFIGVQGMFLTILLGSVFGLLIGVPVSWWRGRLAPMNTYLPLGTFLALGAAVAEAWGDHLIDWYLAVALGA